MGMHLGKMCPGKVKGGPAGERSASTSVSDLSLGGSDGKESAFSARDPGSVYGLGRSLGEGNGNPLQYSCLDNPMDRGTWWAIVHGVRKSQTCLSTHAVT